MSLAFWKMQHAIILIYTLQYDGAVHIDFMQSSPSGLICVHHMLTPHACQPKLATAIAVQLLFTRARQDTGSGLLLHRPHQYIVCINMVWR